MKRKDYELQLKLNDAAARKELQALESQLKAIDKLITKKKVFKIDFSKVNRDLANVKKRLALLDKLKKTYKLKINLPTQELKRTEAAVSRLGKAIRSASGSSTSGGFSSLAADLKKISSNLGRKKTLKLDTKKAETDIKKILSLLKSVEQAASHKVSLKVDGASARRTIAAVKRDLSSLQKSAKLPSAPAAEAESSAGAGLLAGAAFGKALPGIAAAAAAAVSLKDIIDTYSDFTDELRAAQAVYGGTADTFNQLADAAAKAGRETAFTASQAAQTLRILAQAGVPLQEAIDGLQQLLNFASAGRMDLAEAASISLAIISQYGKTFKDIGEVTDKVAKAATLANTDIRALGSAFSYAGPVAKAFGLSIEETLGFLDLLAEGGYSGERGGTYLRGVLGRLIQDSDKANEALKRLGVQLRDTTGKLKTPAEIFRAFADAKKKFEAGLLPEVTSFGEEMSRIFETINTPAALILVDKIGTLDEKINEITSNSAEYAKKTAELIESDLGGSMRRAKSAVESLEIALAKLINKENNLAIDAFAAAVRGLAGAVSSLKDESDEALSYLLELGDALFSRDKSFIETARRQREEIKATSALREEEERRMEVAERLIDLQKKLSSGSSLKIASKEDAKQLSDDLTLLQEISGRRDFKKLAEDIAESLNKERTAAEHLSATLEELKKTSDAAVDIDPSQRLTSYAEIFNRLSKEADQAGVSYLEFLKIAAKASGLTPSKMTETELKSFGEEKFAVASPEAVSAAKNMSLHLDKLKEAATSLSEAEDKLKSTTEALSNQLEKTSSRAEALRKSLDAERISAFSTEAGAALTEFSETLKKTHEELSASADLSEIIDAFSTSGALTEKFEAFSASFLSNTEKLTSGTKREFQKLVSSYEELSSSVSSSLSSVSSAHEAFVAAEERLQSVSVGQLDSYISEYRRAFDSILDQYETAAARLDSTISSIDEFLARSQRSTGSIQEQIVATENQLLESLSRITDSTSIDEKLSEYEKSVSLYKELHSKLQRGLEDRKAAISGDSTSLLTTLEERIKNIGSILREELQGESTHIREIGTATLETFEAQKRALSDVFSRVADDTARTLELKLELSSEEISSLKKKLQGELKKETYLISVRAETDQLLNDLKDVSDTLSSSSAVSEQDLSELSSRVDELKKKLSTGTALFSEKEKETTLKNLDDVKSALSSILESKMKVSVDLEALRNSLKSSEELILSSYESVKKKIESQPITWNLKQLVKYVPVAARNSGGFTGKIHSGFVPGTGNSDTVPALLTPGEYTVRAPAARVIGAPALEFLNHFDKYSKQGYSLQITPPGQKQEVHVNLNIGQKTYQMTTDSQTAEEFLAELERRERDTI